MTKCKRCNCVAISVTGVTCLCGEPLSYIRYYPKDGDYPTDGRSMVTSRRREAYGHGLSAHVYNDLLKEIKRFCSAHSYPYSSFGKRFFNDPNLVYRLMNGASPREATVTKLRTAMRDYENGNRAAA